MEKSRRKKVAETSAAQITRKEFKTGPKDDRVAAALTAALLQVYNDSGCSGNIAASVNGDVEFLEDRQCCCFASMEEAVTSRSIAGIPGGHFLDGAIGAYDILTRDTAYMSLQADQQADQQQATGAMDEKMCTDRGDREQHETATSGRNDRPQTARESTKPQSECTKHIARCAVKIDAAPKGALLEQARLKAEAEMTAEFCFDSLCEQGKRLYEIVLIDKTKRLHNKLKHRSKWREKKKAAASAE